jgi:hypothetical protein
VVAALRQGMAGNPHALQASLGGPQVEQLVEGTVSTTAPLTRQLQSVLGHVHWTL